METNKYALESVNNTNPQSLIAKWKDIFIPELKILLDCTSHWNNSPEQTSRLLEEALSLRYSRISEIYETGKITTKMVKKTWC